MTPRQNNEHLGTIICAGIRRNISGQHVLCIAFMIDGGKVMGDRFYLHSVDADFDRLDTLAQATSLDHPIDTPHKLIGRRAVVVFDKDSDEFHPPLTYLEPRLTEMGAMDVRVVPCMTCAEAWLTLAPTEP